MAGRGSHTALIPLEVSRFQLERVRAQLADDRRAGAAFGAAWRHAVSSCGSTVRRALVTTEEAWRRAYEREPVTPADLAVARLLALIVDDDSPEDERAGRRVA